MEPRDAVLRKDATASSTSHGYIPERQTLAGDGTGRSIEGLRYIRDFLRPDEVAALQAEVDGGPWDDDNQNRRTQQWGFGMHWRHRRDNALRRLESPRDGMPSAALGPLQRLEREGAIPAAHVFDQCIVNDYVGGQGIRPHIDRRWFGEHVVGLSMGAPVVMDFKHLQTHEVVALLLEPGSALVLSGPSRWEWQHAISPDPVHVYRGEVIRRKGCRRTSLTFRSVSDRSVIVAESDEGGAESSWLTAWERPVVAASVLLVATTAVAVAVLTTLRRSRRS